MNIFYLPSLAPSHIPGIATLGEEESYHCSRVLRMKPGTVVHLTDGQGNLYEGSLLVADSNGCQVEIQSVQEYRNPSHSLHIAIAPTKNIDRFEWFLEKATEIGVQEITPLYCEHSERTTLRTDRLQKILVSAMKQSMNLHLPVLHEPVSFRSFLAGENTAQKFIGYVEEKQEIHLSECYKPGSDAIILIGPEGDFSKEEVRMALSSGYKAVSLGNSRLRTETAGVVACVMVEMMNQKG